MPTPFRRFEPEDATVLAGPAFDIGDVHLRCLPYKPAGVLEDLPMLAQLDDLLAFVRGCLIDEDVEAFNVAIHDKRRIVRQELVVEIYEWLAEAYTDFIPGLPSPSESGQPVTAPTSEDASASRDGTQTLSTSAPTAR